MDYLNYGETRIPKLGLGTWKLEGDRARETVSTAIELGYRHIDTAAKYENEEEVGAAVMTSGIPRPDFFITTKIWRDFLHFDEVLSETDRSLERLGTDYVDLLLIHWPNEEVPLQETMTALKAVMQEGRARHIGVSNFPPGMLSKARAFAPVLCEQVEFHVFLQQQRLRQLIVDADQMLTAYCPLARGEINDDHTLCQIGDRYDKSPAQVALRWLMQLPQVAAIPKASSREHLAENIAIFDFELTQLEMDEIGQLDRAERIIDPDFAPAWQQ